MAIRNISQITCSLNLGLIYSVNYSYSPDSGCEITLFFVNQQGTYFRPIYLQKAFIQIGNASFSMNVVASDIQLSAGRRVIEVTFVDDTYLLNNYSIVLTGKGRGFNVYELGAPVDHRTLAQKQADALDPTAQKIIDLTTFPDVEYAFFDFLTILRQKFTVQITAAYNTTVTNVFTGTFRQVLDQWCSFFALSWFIENGAIKIFDPTTLIFTLPTQPIDAIEFNSLEDVRDTYGKTCYNWYQQEGGEFPLNQTSDENGDLLVRTETLFPIGYEFNLPQKKMDLDQVAAAQFGPNFWFLYNYNKGSTATECGWTPLSVSTSLNISQSVGQIGRIAAVNQNQFEAQYEAYSTYGKSIAGRYYMSYAKNDLAVDQNYQWFDESQGQIFNFTNVDSKAMNLDYLTPTNQGNNIIPETFINVAYSGVNYFGNRMVYQDTVVNATQFVLPADQEALVNSTFQSIYSIPGSQSLDFNSELAPIYGNLNTYVGYNAITVPQSLAGIFNNISAYATGFAPRFKSIPIKGVTHSDYASLKASQNESDDVDIVNGSDGGTIVGNTAVIKTLKGGAYNVYYDKYSQIASAHTTGPYFQHRFEPRQISIDNPVQFTFSKQAGNVYQLNRDYATINALVNNPLLPTLAQARTFLTKRVTFTVNYFYDVPTNFLTNGLVGLSVSIGDGGVTATYSYSNEVLQVPYPENDFAAYEQQIRNSALRHYIPTSVIT